jgi:hypothetical protein
VPIAIQAGLSKADKTGAVTTIGASPNSDGSGDPQTLTVNFSPFFVAAECAYHVTVIRQSAGTGSCSVFSAEIDIVRL